MNSLVAPQHGAERVPRGRKIATALVAALAMIAGSLVAAGPALAAPFGGGTVAPMARPIDPGDGGGGGLFGLVSVQPKITGTKVFGNTLKAVPGSWTVANPTSTIEFSYRWYRGDDVIPGATTIEHVLQPADVGQAISVAVTGTVLNFDGEFVVEQQRVSDQTAAIAPGTITASSAAVYGNARVGEQLSLVTSTWAPAPVYLSYQWLRSGEIIPGATSPIYVATLADRGAELSARIQGTKAGFTPVTITSAVSRTVQDGVFTSRPVPTITGSAKVGDTLTVHFEAWEPEPDAYELHWTRNNANIPGATGETLTLTAADAGKKIAVTVRALREGYYANPMSSAPVNVPAGDDPTDPKPKPKPKPKPTPVVTSPFVDVPLTHKFFTEIRWMHASKLSTGVKTPRGLEYQPKVGVSREAMAAFLYRMEGAKYRAPAVSPFVDVQPGDKFYKEIAWMHSAGLSTGVKQAAGKPAYQPKAKVSREAMAAFIYRLEKASYQGSTASPFVDVTPGSKFFAEITWMHHAGLSTGVRQATGKPAYQPKTSVSREAMAAFLYRLRQ